MTKKEAYKLNQEVESLIKEKGVNRSDYSSDELEKIAQYSGDGGLFDQGARGKGLKFEYFTPDEMVRKMWGMCLANGFEGGQVLEPSAGAGAFLRLQPDKAHLEKEISFDCYEIKEVSANILKILFPNATVHHANFETAFINKNNESVRGEVVEKYDLVIGNPPFGKVGGRYMEMGEQKYTNATRYDEYFISRGLDSLKSGGLLCYVIGAEVANGGVRFLDTAMTKAKELIDNSADLIDAYRLPNGVFDRTDVSSEIVLFRKK